MKKLIYQTCESKECHNIEKDEIGLKNLYIVSRRHIFDDETNELICTICNKVTNLNDIKEQDLKELKKLEKAEKKVLKNKSGQTTVTTKNIKAIALSGQESGHEVINNNVVKKQKVMGESVNDIIEVKKSRGRPKKI